MYKHDINGRCRFTNFGYVVSLWSFMNIEFSFSFSLNLQFTIHFNSVKNFFLDLVMWGSLDFLSKFRPYFLVDIRLRCGQNRANGYPHSYYFACHYFATGEKLRFLNFKEGDPFSCYVSAGSCTKSLDI